MDLKLKDKVILVSGGAKGIGEAIVKVLAAEGAIPSAGGTARATTHRTDASRPRAPAAQGPAAQCPPAPKYFCVHLTSGKTVRLVPFITVLSELLAQPASELAR